MKDLEHARAMMTMADVDVIVSSVQMKHDIQQKRLKETSGLSAEERNRRLDKALAMNHILGPFLKKISASKKGPSN